MKSDKVITIILSSVVLGMSIAHASEATYSVGDKALGGTIFYVNAEGNHGLVAANSDQGEVYSHADAVESCSYEEAFDQEGHIYTDWKLPALHQLDLMYGKKEYLERISRSYVYYSQYPNKYVNLTTGQHITGDGGRTYTYNAVRCIRNF